MRIVGIDPGVRGGVAILDIDNDGVPQVVNVTDIPVAGSGARERVDAAWLCGLLTKHKPAHAYVERAQAMPEQGSSSGFKFGRATGAIEAVLACCEVPMTIVEPAAWKKFHHLRGRDKEASRLRALQLFPGKHVHVLLQRRRDHGRAEAMLIALAGASQRFARDQSSDQVATSSP
jgi:crossover junction endodeoxyribonuclease RuvC